MCLTQKTINKLIELEFPIKTNISALPSFEDIWKELPIMIEIKKKKTYVVTLVKNPINGKDYICYRRGNNVKYVFGEYNNITEAAALLWIKLKEDGII